MATKTDTATISAAQEIAIAALIRGATVTEAATEAGVTRQTVSGWRNHDPEFIASLNRSRREVWDEVEDRLRALHLKALAVITSELEGSDARDISIDVLKVLSRMSVVPTGATTAREITRQQIVNELMLL